MRPGRESLTAVMVCMDRAIAHERAFSPRFSDPTALELLPPEARARFEKFRSNVIPATLRDRMERAFNERRARMMMSRTVAIDDAVREVASPQVVILGAGLDGRAWRMPELSEAVVFEVDHPDSQRQKRARLGALKQRAREVRFVPVDFTRDDLEVSLQAAGHDPSRPTTWLWEGVVMYLTPAEVESTLRVLEKRSAPASRLVIVYHAPARILWLVGLLVRRMGEPLKSSFTPEAMRALLQRFGFGIVRDEDMPSVGASISAELAKDMRGIKHLRIVTADRP